MPRDACDVARVGLAHGILEDLDAEAIMHFELRKLRMIAKTSYDPFPNVLPKFDKVGWKKIKLFFNIYNIFNIEFT